MPDPPTHIAQIRPVGRRQSGNLLSLASLLVSSALLIAFQAGWVLAMFAGLLMLSINATAAAVLLLISLAWLCLQFALVFMYPEWPLNRLLTHRLCRSVETRLNPLVSPAEEGVRVVELVPRPRWQKLALETAIDLMLIRVDDQGVWMTGDRCEYSLGRDSILGAELHSVTPSGWFTATHMVIVYVRTDEGQIELPLAYRDHGFGSLRSSRRARRPRTCCPASCGSHVAIFINRQLNRRVAKSLAHRDGLPTPFNHRRSSDRQPGQRSAAFL